MNLTDVNPPLFSCPDGYFIVYTNTSDSGYLCQSYEPVKPVHTQFVNVTEITARVKEPVPKQPPVIKSAFFMSNPVISSS
jgi:hypothetical protein